MHSLPRNKQKSFYEIVRKIDNKHVTRFFKVNFYYLLINLKKPL